MPLFIRRWATSLPVFLIVCALLFMWRRPVELFHPYIWVEDGTISLPAYLAKGWASIWDPVAGYLVVPSKLIFLTAFSLSAKHFPQVAYALTLVFEIGTLALIALSPTHLRYPRLAALAIILIPTHPEVFAVSEYAFWWGGLWSFVALFWREEGKPRTAWRCVLVIVGGLSSPMSVPAAGLLGLRAAWHRKRSDLIVFLAAMMVAALQVYMIFTTSASVGFGERHFNLFEIVKRFFGHFLVSTERVPALVLFCLGLAIIAGIAVFSVWHRKWRDIYYVMLCGCLAVSIVAGISRVAVEIIHPILAGPRYFFYPFIFLVWLLLYIYGEVGTWSRRAISLVLLCALSQFALHGRFVYDTFRWRTELKQCTASTGTYQFPIQYAGPKEIAWHVPLTGAQCQDLIDRSIFK